MNNTLTTVYDLDSLLESFDQSIRRMEEMAKESPIIEDWCQGYAAACAEAIIRIRNHVLNVGNYHYEESKDLKLKSASLYGESVKEA